jgi:hypothetical protein
MDTGDYYRLLMRNLGKFRQPGDVLKPVSVSIRPNSTCELCMKPDISEVHVLRNETKGTQRNVGNECIENYLVALTLMDGQAVSIQGSPSYLAEKERIRRRKSEVAERVERARMRAFGFEDEEEDELEEDYEEEDEDDYDEDADNDLTPEGLGADEIDWESASYELD